MPKGWNWYKRDVSNIRAIAERFGRVCIRTFPTHSTVDYILDEFFRGISWISFLDYLFYNKFDALDMLEHNYGYKRYPFKHYESIFTRYYQGYILPQKFGVDKRLIHFSTLIASGQMTRTEALEGLVGIPYPSQKDLESDTRYFLKKMGWDEAKLNSYIKRTQVPHDAYLNEMKYYTFLKNLLPLHLKKSLMKWLNK